eukprot:TRINITY_DN3904_c0_g1_i2.p1 TRINITY_DN3904_c0_g1~~TRINITY_DN3904_c0_g1_i2.p1  ORF type:complete len:369 (+),score=62.74 TRINITY_DN3904_c0_g1_i2:360-1466(+)
MVSGFQKLRQIKILHEELCYNQNFEPYRILLIHSFFVGGDMTVSKTNENETIITNNIRSCIEYLSSFSENFPVLRELNEEVRNFKSSYVFVAGYEHDAISRVGNIIDQYTKKLIAVNNEFKRMKGNQRQYMELCLIVESYVMAGLFGFLIIEFRRIFEDEDRKFLKMCRKHRSTPFVEFQMDERFNGNFDEPIQKLNQLETNQSPMEMMHCFQVVINSLLVSVENNLKANGYRIEEEAVTTDELIPLIAYLLTRSTLKYLPSTLFYIENFVFSNISTTELGFHLINLKAALDFIMGDNLPDVPDIEILDTEFMSVKKSLSIRNSQKKQKKANIKGVFRNSTNLSLESDKQTEYEAPPDVIQIRKADPN